MRFAIGGDVTFVKTRRAEEEEALFNLLLEIGGRRLLSYHYMDSLIESVWMRRRREEKKDGRAVP